MWQKLPQNSFNIMKYGWMEVFRLFRGFRMQTRKNCQPQSHPSVLECSKGNFRLNIQAFRNSAFLLICPCAEKSRDLVQETAEFAAKIVEAETSWNFPLVPVSLIKVAGHPLKPGATVGGNNWNVYVPLVLFSVDSRQFTFCARIPQTNLIRTIVLPSKWLSTTLRTELHMINSVKLTIMTHTWRNLCKYLLTKIFSGQLTSFVYSLQVVINPQDLLSHIS